MEEYDEVLICICLYMYPIHCGEYSHLLYITT
jgi:hypothetical protein